MKKTLIFIILFLAVILIYLVSLMVIDNQPTKQDDFQDDQMATDAYILGTIYDFSQGEILVAEGLEIEDYSGQIDQLIGNAIWLKLDQETEIINGQIDDLIIGTKVEVWTKGLILETYPAQSTAGKIIIQQDELIEKPADQCYLGGCSNEICSNDPEAISSCELLPGMECLEHALCLFVEDQCDWVLSEQAALCFIEIEKEHGQAVRQTRIGYLFEKADFFRNN